MNSGLELGYDGYETALATQNSINNSAHLLSRSMRSLSRWLSKSHRKKQPNSEYTHGSIFSLEKSLRVKSSDSISNSSLEVNEIDICTNNNKKTETKEEPTKKNKIIHVSSSKGKGSRVELLDESWEDWQLDYQKGGYNLSCVERPTCFNGFGHMTAPLHRNESLRLRMVEKVSNYEIWNSLRSWLNTRIKILLKKHRLKSATVSLLDHATQKIMFDVGLGYQFDTLGRELSIDAHAILSTDHFALLDASSDWRTKLNPLVYGPPFIKFYLGIPLFYKNLPVGCVAIVDPYLKTRVPPTLISELKQLAHDIIEKYSSLMESSAQRNVKALGRGKEYLSEAYSQKPYNVRFDETSGSSQIISKDNSRADSDSVSYTSAISSHSSCCPSISQESLLRPFTIKRTKLQPLSSCQAVLQPYEVFESLLKCLNVQQAIKKACRMVMQNIGVNAVYISEVRILQKAFIGDHYHNYNGRTISSIEQQTTVRRLESPEVRARLAGSCKPNIDVTLNDELVQRNIDLLKAAIPSRYGLKFTFDSHEEAELFTCGLMIPLRSQTPTYKQTGDLGEIQSGGFVMTAMCTTQRDFSPGDCAFMKKVTQALENILTCNDEVVSKQ